MIGVTFQAPDLKFQTGTIPMPLVPRVGDQIFLSDFITEEDEEKILKTNTNPDIDHLFVNHVTWFRSPKEKEIYVLVILLTK